MLNHVSFTRSYHSTDSDTESSLVGSKMRPHPKQFYRSKQKGRSRVDTSRVMNQELREQLSKIIDEALEKCSTYSAQTRWDFTREVKYKAHIDTFGKMANKNEDWLVAGIDSLGPPWLQKAQHSLNIGDR